MHIQFVTSYVLPTIFQKKNLNAEQVIHALSIQSFQKTSFALYFEVK